MPKDLLPPYEKLTKDQDRAIRYPDHISLLVVGPPGSGKTVIALFRAKELLKHNKTVRLLVYGNVLHSYLIHAIKSLDIDISTSTFHKWFPDHIKRTFNKYPPKLADFVYNFNEIMTWYNDFPCEFDQLIIDEGQDIPNDFFRLAARMSKGITVFADENQSIFEGSNSTIAQIRTTLKKFNPVEVKLTKNFRNTKRIAEFAALFMVEGLESGATEPPDELGEYPIIMKARDTEQQLDMIFKYSSQFPNKSIGVFLFNKKDVGIYYRSLKRKCLNDVQYYFGGKRMSPPDFSKSGIYVVTYHSAKGLEFDTVFVPEAHKIAYDGTPKVKMLLYVVMTRPRERLVILHQGDNMPNIIQHAVGEKSINTKLYEAAEISNTAPTKMRNTAVLPEITHQNPERTSFSTNTFNNDNVKISDFLLEIGESNLDDNSIERATNIIKRVYGDRVAISKEELIIKLNVSMTGSLRSGIFNILDKI